MINLIPNAERKKMIKDFYLRLVVVVFFAIGLSVLAASILLLPSYFASNIKLNIANTKLATQRKEPVPDVDQKITGSIKEINNRLSLVERFQKDKYVVTERVINQVLLHKTADIKITEISYEESVPKTQKIIINGTAPSRERLLVFRRALEEDTSFSKVDLPISNFIKGSNIQFSITLIPS